MLSNCCFGSVEKSLTPRAFYLGGLRDVGFRVRAFMVSFRFMVWDCGLGFRGRVGDFQSVRVLYFMGFVAFEAQAGRVRRLQASWLGFSVWGFGLRDGVRYQPTSISKVIQEAPLPHDLRAGPKSSKLRRKPQTPHPEP